MLKKVAKRIIYFVWVLNGYAGWALRSHKRAALTVLITYYNPARLRHINDQIRNVLKCEFVERLVISCHNPDVKIENHVNVRSRRLVLLNQDIRKPCGYRWTVARKFSADYLLVIDDDVFLFPFQFKLLFEHLLNEPDVPHGFAGMIDMGDGNYQYHQKENISLQYLCEAYAVTRQHVERYLTMSRAFEQDRSLPTAADHLGDFILISQTGAADPKIHRIGHILRDETFDRQGVANHKENDFSTVLMALSRAVKQFRRAWVEEQRETLEGSHIPS